MAKKDMADIEEVRKFWETNPLFSDESDFQTGSREYFEEHKKVYLEDVFAGKFNEESFIPIKLPENAKILDLGCGTGFWTVELLLRTKFKNMYAADLTSRALELTKKRLELYGLTGQLSIQNAEKMTYEDSFFNHVNCQGVIHHTPDTSRAIQEIARVLKKNGTAYISVYYKNIFLKVWPRLSLLGKIMHFFGAGLKGRGREKIFLKSDPDEITRLYDGDKNPIGKCYTKKEIREIVSPFFSIEKVFLNYFPARALPIKLPRFIHLFLSKYFGFMVHLNLRKK